MARHCHDHDAYQRVLDERGDCPKCWADTAKAAADAADLLLIRCGPLPHMDVYGNVSGSDQRDENDESDEPGAPPER